MLLPRLLFLLLASFFLSLSAGIDLWEEIKNGVNKLETDRQRIIWDDEGIRVEEKPWYERAWASLNKGIFGDENRRIKRLKDVDSKGPKEEIDQKAWPKPGAEEEEEVVDTAKAKIVLFRNGTRVVDVDGGPLVTVNPDGGMVVDYRNGTVKRMNGTRKGLTEEGKGGGRRSKRFNSIDDLYLFHGWRSSGRDPEEFGKDGFKASDWDRFWQPKGRSSDDEETEEEEDEEEEGSPKIGPKHWGWKEEDAYWNRPLYGQIGGTAAEGKRPVKSIVGDQVVNDDAQPTGMAQGQDQQHGPSSPLITAHQPPSSPSSSSPQNSPHPSAGTVNQSPPLTPEELEKIRVLFHRHQQNGVIQQSNVVDQTANGTRHGIGANGFGENGANSEKKSKGQQNPTENIQNIQDQDKEPRQVQQHQSLAKPPKWAKPK